MFPDGWIKAVATGVRPRRGTAPHRTPNATVGRNPEGLWEHCGSVGTATEGRARRGDAFVRARTVTRNNSPPPPHHSPSPKTRVAGKRVGVRPERQPGLSKGRERPPAGGCLPPPHSRALIPYHSMVSRAHLTLFTECCFIFRSCYLFAIGLESIFVKPCVRYTTRLELQSQTTRLER